MAMKTIDATLMDKAYVKMGCIAVKIKRVSMGKTLSKRAVERV